MRNLVVAALCLAACSDPTSTPNPDAGFDSPDGGIGLVATLEAAGGVTDVLLSETLTYVLGQSEVLVLDLADPANPKQLGQAKQGGVSLDLEETRLLIGSEQSVIEMDVSTTTPSLLREHVLAPRTVGRVVGSGDYLYVASGNDLLVLDRKQDPALIGALGMGGAVLDVAHRTDMILGATSEHGFVTVDLTDFPPTAHFYQIETETEALAAFSLGETFAIVGATSEIALFDVKDPPRPARLWRRFGSNRLFALRGDELFALGPSCSAETSNAGLRTFDLSDSNAVTQVGCTNLSDLSAQVRVEPVHGRGFDLLGNVLAVVVDGLLRIYVLPSD